MFKSFRWQIALWFVGLSSVIYLALCLAGALYFYNSLQRAMDDQLKVVASQIGHAIDLTGSTPKFRDWLRVVKTEPERSLISMQLFDSSGRLLEHYGPVGIPRLFLQESEVSDGAHKLRTRQSRLLHNGTLIGYLQLQLPVERRDASTREFVITMLVMAPLVLTGFGACSYIVSGIAARPIVKVVSTLQSFVADAGHELNTPAGIVQARAQSLGRKLEKHGLFFEDIEIIAGSAERMGQIVKNLMLLAELDAKSHRTAKNAIDANELISSLAAEFAQRFEEKGIQLKWNKTDETVFVPDGESVECILRNLLENALRYTESGGMVAVTCRAGPAEATMTVEDTGIGIPQESLARIFDRFYRVDDSRSRASGGSGLGLSIVKALARSLGGSVQATSQEGKGSSFVVVLPLSKSAVAQKLHTSLFHIN